MKDTLRFENIVKQLQNQLSLNITWNGKILECRNLCTEGAKVLAKILESGDCPHGLQIHLRYNNIGDEGAKALINALENSNCPEGLHINLRYNAMSIESAKALAKTLASGKCPAGLKINLEGNYIAYEGAKLLLKAVQYNYTLAGLQMYYLNNEQVSLLKSLLKRNTTQIHIATSFRFFAHTDIDFYFDSFYSKDYRKRKRNKQISFLEENDIPVYQKLKK